MQPIFLIEEKVDEKSSLYFFNWRGKSSRKFSVELNEPDVDDDSSSSVLLRPADVRDVRVGASDDVPRLSRHRKFALVQPLLTPGKKFGALLIVLRL